MNLRRPPALRNVTTEPVEDAVDPFSAIVKFCQPTASQLAKFPSCPLDREVEGFHDPDPFPCPAPGSQNSADQQTEDNAVFHTPPEHHLQSNLSSSEDQNPNDLCADGAWTVDLDGSKKVRGESKKKVGVLGKGVSGGAVPLEGVVKEMRLTESVGDEIIVLGCGDSDEETMGVDSQHTGKQVTVDVGVAGGVDKSSCLQKQRAFVVDASDENLRLSECNEPMRNIGVDKGDTNNNNNVSSDISESLASSEAEEEIVNLKILVAGNKSGNPGEASGNEDMSNDGNGVKGRRTACRKIEEIDEFRFSGWENAGRKWKEIPTPSKRKRELPASMVEKEKNEGRSNVVGEEAAKSRGLNKGKEGAGNVVRKADTKSGHLNKEKGKNAEGSNVTGIIATNTDQPKKQKDNNDGGGNVAREMEIVAREMEIKSDQLNLLAGKAEAKIGQLDDGEEKNEGGSKVAGMVEKEKKSGLLDILGVLKTVIKNLDNDGGSNDENVDFLETAKKRGVTFPRPRWWPPEGEEM